jgi:hypothetical protein
MLPMFGDTTVFVVSVKCQNMHCFMFIMCIVVIKWEILIL